MTLSRLFLCKMHRNFIEIPDNLLRLINVDTAKVTENTWPNATNVFPIMCRSSQYICVLQLNTEHVMFIAFDCNLLL